MIFLNNIQSYMIISAIVYEDNLKLLVKNCFAGIYLITYI